MNAKPQFDENAVCEVCGKYGAYQFGERWLCAECYEAMGSCCPEFGGHDQWEIEDDHAAGAATDPKNKSSK